MDAHLLFDWSGVISNDLQLVLDTINYILSHYNKDQLTKKEFCSNYLSNPKQWYQQQGIFDYETVKNLFRKRFTEGPEPEPIPGAVEAVRSIAQRDHIHIVIFSSHPNDLLKSEVAKYGLDKTVSKVLGSTKKDFPHPFIEALLESVYHDRLIYFGDTTVDITLANQHGINSVAVASDYAYHDETKLRSANPTHVISSINKAPSLVEKILR